MEKVKIKEVLEWLTLKGVKDVCIKVLGSHKLLLVVCKELCKSSKTIGHNSLERSEVGIRKRTAGDI